MPTEHQGNKLIVNRKSEIVNRVPSFLSRMTRMDEPTANDLKNFEPSQIRNLRASRVLAFITLQLPVKFLAKRQSSLIFMWQLFSLRLCDFA